MEITIGKLSTAIRILLLFAFEAIPDSKVNEAENPKALKVIARQKSPRSAIGFFKSKTKRPKPAKDKISVSKKL